MKSQLVDEMAFPNHLLQGSLSSVSHVSGAFGPGYYLGCDTTEKIMANES